jgi:hypothetical protein
MENPEGVMVTGRSERCLPSLGAGVLCYSIPPDSEEIFFLLGRESGEGKNFVRKCWCDFGGRMEDGESEEDTAAREFFEESMGLVCTDQCLERRYDEGEMPIHAEGGESTALHDYEIVDRIARALKENGFSFRVRMCLNHGASPDVPRRFNVTYVKQIPWNPRLPADFAILKEKMTSLYDRSTRLIEMARSMIDERGVCRYPIPGCTMIEGDLEFLAHPEEEEDEPDPAVVFIIGLDDIEYDAETDECTVSVEYHRLDSDHIDRRTVRVAGEYCFFLRSWKELEEYYHSLPESFKSHPCVHSSDYGIVSVRPEFLEKDCLQYWSQERLRDMLDNGGHYKKEYFRSTFIPTIAVVLRVLQDLRRGARDAHNRYTIYCKPKCDVATETVEQ